MWTLCIVGIALYKRKPVCFEYHTYPLAGMPQCPLVHLVDRLRTSLGGLTVI